MRSLPGVLVVVGAATFICVLALSAYWEPDIRALHAAQSLMYVVTIALVWRRNRWGYFIGTSAAAFWNYLNLFVTTFFVNGLRYLAASLRASQVEHADQIIAVPAWLGNFAIIVGCIWAYWQLRDKKASDWIRALVAFSVTTAYFAAAIAALQPRYLPLFARALHPHWR